MSPKVASRPRVYLDYHATTPVDPRVLEAMLPFFSERFGNPSSRAHAFGWEAERALELARRQVADLIGARTKEVVFTSGATESINLAIQGAVRGCRDQRNHLVTAVSEHSAVLGTCRALEADGCPVTYVPTQPDGLVDPTAIEAAISDRTILISVMAANNEIGVLQNLGEIGSLAKRRGVLFHTDAAQAAGKVPLDVEAMGIDLLSLSAHKLYGPKGVGALYVRRKNPRVILHALLHGGGQESGVRPGTVNVPGIVGLGKAAEICREEMREEGARLGALRDRLCRRLVEALPDIQVNGSMEHRLPHNLNVSIARVDGSALVIGLSDVAVSSGSACSSAGNEPSHVLRALGLSAELALASIRFGLGRFTTQEEVDYAADRLIDVVIRLRESSPLTESESADADVELGEISWRAD